MRAPLARNGTAASTESSDGALEAVLGSGVGPLGDKERRTVPVSVVVCAYTDRRFDDIVACVASITDQSVHPLEVLLVVDHEPALAERLRRRLPEIQILENEGERGLSGARNTGIRHAQGALIAFLDDDAKALGGWLEGIASSFDDPAVLAVGGRAIPLWPVGGRPSWFPEAFDWVVGCSFPGQPTVPGPVRNLMGCNMGFRRSVFARSGGFSTDLGRIGRNPLGCEETELCIRARRDEPGGTVIFDPRIAVEHRVTSERATPRYFLSRCWGEGLSKAAVSQMVGTGDALESERNYVAVVLPRAALDALKAVLAGSDVTGLWRLAALVGGLGATAAGYARARASTALRRASPGAPPRSR